MRAPLFMFNTIFLTLVERALSKSCLKNAPPTLSYAYYVNILIHLQDQFSIRFSIRYEVPKKGRRKTKISNIIELKECSIPNKSNLTMGNLAICITTNISTTKNAINIPIPIGTAIRFLWDMDFANAMQNITIIDIDT